jgi:hypothetical protein
MSAIFSHGTPRRLFPFGTLHLLHLINHVKIDTPQLPDSFSDWYRETFDLAPSDAIITHCKRELIQALWLLLLNTPGFVQAYEFGILICFADKVLRRVFPRFFAYIADYPEK